MLFSRVLEEEIGALPLEQGDATTVEKMAIGLEIVKLVIGAISATDVGTTATLKGIAETPQDQGISLLSFLLCFYCLLYIFLSHKLQWINVFYSLHYPFFPVTKGIVQSPEKEVTAGVDLHLTGK